MAGQQLGKLGVLRSDGAAHRVAQARVLGSVMRYTARVPSLARPTIRSRCNSDRCLATFA